MTDSPPPIPPGGRRVPRPKIVEPCGTCGRPLIAGYADCRECHDALERIWLADWEALLEQEGIAAGSEDERLLAKVVLGEYERHPWTVLDIAMTLVRCDECGRELGEGYPDCGACSIAFGTSIASEFDATPNEHALHVGRWILRFPHRNSAAIVTAWRMTMPHILTGWLPTTEEAQRGTALVREGRLEEARRLLTLMGAGR